MSAMKLHLTTYYIYIHIVYGQLIISVGYRDYESTEMNLLVLPQVAPCRDPQHRVDPAVATGCRLFGPR